MNLQNCDIENSIFRAHIFENQMNKYRYNMPSDLHVSVGKLVKMSPEGLNRHTLLKTLKVDPLDTSGTGKHFLFFFNIFAISKIFCG